MHDFLGITEVDGLYSTVIPPFSNNFWTSVLPASGYVWVESFPLDLSAKLDGIVSESLFGSRPIELRCNVHRLEADISIPVDVFIEHAGTVFRHGLDIFHSDKQQPSGLQIRSIPKTNWRRVFVANEVNLALHRPAGGEPSLVTACDKAVLSRIIDRYRLAENEV